MESPSIVGIEERSDSKVPELLSVNYDLWTLRLTLSFKPSQFTYVDFEEVEGFRVLDEGQLLEFWSEQTKYHWIFEIESNGWLSAEASRKTAPSLSEGEDLKEYLVAGINECVSILSYKPPVVIYKA
ncbi:hypothetical protein [Pseudoalteromonas rubra]|uniref:hypothetical protein n=1 Tax=Pseudoalteromonas rubra TaxID=43658 RepID=UPI002DB68501|nr:hypothetical protein [Pseudoalteromonas rubra]MEC4089593.1 hypothetical protein [Pseudoalteromonas rubra]